MELTKFIDKLNKVDGNIYVIEECVELVDGVYTGMLRHDNITPSSLTIHTGPKLTGDRIESYVVSTPSLMPWKREIRVYADVSRVYISYECDGDTVEAEDINKIHEAINITQRALNSENERSIMAEGDLKKTIDAETERSIFAEQALSGRLIDETERAKQAENRINSDLITESERAKKAEKENTESINAESNRAINAESTLTNNLNEEISRASHAESLLDTALEAEKNRAKDAETALSDDISSEATRAKAAEKVLTDNLSSESDRATGAEKTLTDNLNAETIRAKAAEKTLTDNLAVEVSRAKAAEKVNSDNLTAESNRAKAAEKSNADNITQETSRAKAKETELQNSIQAEAGRAATAEESIRNTINTNKPNWDDKYTKNEVDNKFSALETAIDWKEAVNTFADLASVYPKPDDGWTVNVKDTDYTYRWNGMEWIAISANAIPKATQNVDGLLSKEDKTNYDETYTKRHTHGNKSIIDKLTQSLLDKWSDAYNKRHEHGNKSVIDKVTQTLLDNWNGAYTHISDAVKHITAAERTNWNDANSKKHSHSNKSIIDGITQTFVDTWNSVENKVDKVTGKGLSTNDYTDGEKNIVADVNAKKHTHSNKAVIDKLTQAMLDKLAGIATGAEVNVQSDWLEVDTESDSYIKNKPSSMPASDVAAWAKAAAKPSYGWTEISGKPNAFTPLAHNHTKSQITDMPTKVSQFTNDAGYITQDEVDKTQNHTHSNKNVLDKITQEILDKLAGIAEGANKYIHPTTAGSKHIPAGGVSGQILRWSADGTAIWGADNNTTYTAFSGASASVAGKAGLVPAPAAGSQTKYLRADGIWQTPPDTKYSHPASGVTAGTYQSVTVNSQGHVTGGTPTGPFTWNQVHGAYTWDNLKGV